jgi:hypothetical protein
MNCSAASAATGSLPPLKAQAELEDRVDRRRCGGQALYRCRPYHQPFCIPIPAVVLCAMRDLLRLHDEARRSE